MSELNELQLQRRHKLDQIKAMGIDPYPADLWDVNAHSEQILKEFNAELNNFQDVSISGRIMSLQPKGKVCFMKIQDHLGRLQQQHDRSVWAEWNGTDQLQLFGEEDWQKG